MKKKYISFLKKITLEVFPPFLIFLMRNIFFIKKIKYKNYPSWQDAVLASTGYDSENVIEKIKRSTELVRDGYAEYERDSVIFDEIQYSFPLLASLLLVATNCNSLRLIDFGGALGSSFYQNRKFLRSLEVNYEWRIVEQQKFVEIGNAEFSNNHISFYKNIREANSNSSNVILFGSSICYVENPYYYLREAIELEFKYIIFDRTPITQKNYDTFCVQHVPEAIYKASYPIRNFNIHNIIKLFEKDYDLIESWICDLQPDSNTTAKGFLFKRKKNI